ALGLDGKLRGYAETVAVGAAEVPSELASGIGRLTGIDELKEAGDLGQQAAHARSNIVKPEGTAGALAHSAGRLAVELPGAVVAPGGAAGHAAYWGGLSGVEGYGRGETAEQALKDAGVAAA